MAAINWRALRERMGHRGVPVLMALPSMHMVLDYAEQMGLESVTAGCKTQAEARGKISGYFDKLYKPDPVTIAINGGVVGPPPGWSDEDQEASFDAFLAAGGG
ncbi:hypothetical protein SEA_FUNSIZED_42 [Mycobacterium phage Funsized]|nr:hypothetical protein SEA_FUNSIZED_42 [Mycobacterium phage Funsized]